MVLIIDDQEEVLDIYRMMIEGTPYSSQLLTLQDGHDALLWLEEQLARQQPFPRYVLVDLEMPDMNGIEFIKRFEQAFAIHCLPTRIVVLTNSIREKDQQQALSYSSVHQFIAKPLTHTQLLEFLSSD